MKQFLFKIHSGKNRKKNHRNPPVSTVQTSGLCCRSSALPLRSLRTAKSVSSLAEGNGQSRGGGVGWSSAPHSLQSDARAFLMRDTWCWNITGMAKNWTISLPPTPHRFSTCFNNIQHVSMFSAGIIYKVTLSSLDISACGHASADCWGI